MVGSNIKKGGDRRGTTKSGDSIQHFLGGGGEENVLDFSRRNQPTRTLCVGV